MFKLLPCSSLIHTNGIFPYHVSFPCLYAFSCLPKGVKLIVVFLYKDQRKNYANKCHRLRSTTVVTTDRALLFCGWHFWNSLVVRARLG